MQITATVIDRGSKPMSEHYVLRWRKDNIPFWKTVEGDKEINIHTVAFKLTKLSQLEAEIEALRERNETLLHILRGAQAVLLAGGTLNEQWWSEANDALQEQAGE